jgi:alcohol dehydrogenase class IV
MVALEKNKSNLIATAFLSLTHCIEGVASANGNPFADSAAFSAIRLIFDNLNRVVKKRNDRKALLGLINGIAIAGTVNHNTQAGIVGLSSQFLSMQTGVEAGLIAGFTLPVFIKYKLDNGIAIRDELLLALKGIDYYCAVSKGERLAEAQKTLADLTGLISTKNVFSSIQTHLFEKAAKYVETESNKSFSQNDCIRILNMAYESSKALSL